MKITKVTPLLEALARRVEAADPSRYREITNAMTSEPLGRVPHCTPGDVVAAAQRARAVQRTWSQRPIAERAEVMLRLHDHLLVVRSEGLGDRPGVRRLVERPLAERDGGGGDRAIQQRAGQPL